MWNFVSANKAKWALLISPETNYHIQKYDGFENAWYPEKRIRALEVTLGSSTDINLGRLAMQNRRIIFMLEPAR
jgi:hypothetical protein